MSKIEVDGEMIPLVTVCMYPPCQELVRNEESLPITTKAEAEILAKDGVLAISHGVHEACLKILYPEFYK